MELIGQLLLVTEILYQQNFPSMLNYSVDHWKTRLRWFQKNPSRGRTSTIPRLPERFGGQDSSRLAVGGGPGRGQQVGQGIEDESVATGGEETDRSTSTALTSAGLSTDCEGPLDPCKPSYSFAIVLKHNSLTLPLQCTLTGTSTDRHSYASWRSSGGHHRTSNQINQKRRKQKTDYENLILLQKIQNVKPSRSVMTSFAYWRC